MGVTVRQGMNMLEGDLFPEEYAVPFVADEDVKLDVMTGTANQDIKNHYIQDIIDKFEKDNTKADPVDKNVKRDAMTYLEDKDLKGLDGTSNENEDKPDPQEAILDDTDNSDAISLKEEQQGEVQTKVMTNITMDAAQTGSEEENKSILQKAVIDESVSISSPQGNVINDSISSSVPKGSMIEENLSMPPTEDNWLDELVEKMISLHISIDKSSDKKQQKEVNTVSKTDMIIDGPLAGNEDEGKSLIQTPKKDKYYYLYRDRKLPFFHYGTKRYEDVYVSVPQENINEEPVSESHPLGNTVNEILSRSLPQRTVRDKIISLSSPKASLIGDDISKPQTQEDDLDEIISACNSIGKSSEEEQQDEVNLVSIPNIAINTTLDEDYGSISIDGQQTEENVFYRQETYEGSLSDHTIFDLLYDASADVNMPLKTYNQTEGNISDLNGYNRNIDNNIGVLIDEAVGNLNLPVNDENIENFSPETNTYDSLIGYNVVMGMEAEEKNISYYPLNSYDVCQDVPNDTIKDVKQPPEVGSNLQVHSELLDYPPHEIKMYNSETDNNIDMGLEAENRSNIDNHLNNDEIKQDITQDVKLSKESMFIVSVNHENIDNPPPKINTNDNVPGYSVVMGVDAVSNNQMKNEDVKQLKLQGIKHPQENLVNFVTGNNVSMGMDAEEKIITYELLDNPPQEIKMYNSEKYNNIDMGLEAENKSNLENHLDNDEIKQDILKDLFQNTKLSQESMFNVSINHENIDNPPPEINTYDNVTGYNVAMGVDADSNNEMIKENVKKLKDTQENLINFDGNTKLLQNPFPKVDIYDDVKNHNLIMGLEAQEKSNPNGHLNNYDVPQNIYGNTTQDIKQPQESDLSLNKYPKHIDYFSHEIKTYNSVSDNNIDMELEAKEKNNLDIHLNSDEIKHDILQDLFQDIIQVQENMPNIDYTNQDISSNTTLTKERSIDSDKDTGNSQMRTDNIVSGNNTVIEVKDEDDINNEIQIIQTQNNVLKEDIADITNIADNLLRNGDKDDETQIIKNTGLKETLNKRTKHHRQSVVLDVPANENTNDTTISVNVEWDLNKICVVCSDKATGYNYKAITCEGCKRFFRLSVEGKKQYDPCKSNNQCIINTVTRTDCKICRFNKCLKMGMKAESVGVVLRQNKEKPTKKKDVAVKRLKTKDSIDIDSEESPLRIPENGGSDYMETLNSASSILNEALSTSETFSKSISPSLDSKGSFLQIPRNDSTSATKISNSSSSSIPYETLSILQKYSDVISYPVEECSTATSQSFTTSTSSTVAPILLTPSSTELPSREETNDLSDQTDVPRTNCVYCGKQGIDKKSIRSHERTQKCYNNRFPEYANLPPPSGPTQKRNRKRKAIADPELKFVPL